MTGDCVRAPYMVGPARVPITCARVPEALKDVSGRGKVPIVSSCFFISKDARIMCTYLCVHILKN